MTFLQALRNILLREVKEMYITVTASKFLSALIIGALNRPDIVRELIDKVVPIVLKEVVPKNQIKISDADFYVLPVEIMLSRSRERVQKPANSEEIDYAYLDSCVIHFNEVETYGPLDRKLLIDTLSGIYARRIEQNCNFGDKVRLKTIINFAERPANLEMDFISETRFIKGKIDPRAKGCNMLKPPRRQR